MNTDDNTQSAPLAPPHYDLLKHPLIHSPESPSYVGCLDILHNAKCLLALFGQMDLDSDSDHGEFSADAAEAFFWLTHMLKHTLRYVSLTLDEIRASQNQHHERLKQSIFVRALQAPDEASQERINSALQASLGIRRTDIDAFIHLLEGENNETSMSFEGED